MHSLDLPFYILTSLWAFSCASHILAMAWRDYWKPFALGFPGITITTFLWLLRPFLSSTRELSTFIRSVELLRTTSLIVPKSIPSTYFPSSAPIRVIRYRSELVVLTRSWAYSWTLTSILSNPARWTTSFTATIWIKRFNFSYFRWLLTLLPCSWRWSIALHTGCKSCVWLDPRQATLREQLIAFLQYLKPKWDSVYSSLPNIVKRALHGFNYIGWEKNPFCQTTEDEFTTFRQFPVFFLNTLTMMNIARILLGAVKSRVLLSTELTLRL